MTAAGPSPRAATRILSPTPAPYAPYESGRSAHEHLRRSPHPARAQTGSRHPAHAATGHGWRRLPRHYLEMVAAMLVGMVVRAAALRGMLFRPARRTPDTTPI